MHTGFSSTPTMLCRIAYVALFQFQPGTLHRSCTSLHEQYALRLCQSTINLNPKLYVTGTEPGNPGAPKPSL